MTSLSTEVSVARRLSRDRVFVLIAIFILTAGSFGFLIHVFVSAKNDLPPCCLHPDPRHWGVADFPALFVMWTVMMIGMMTPTVAPMVLMFAGINRRRREQDRPYVPTALFLLGYLIVWTAFSAIATAA